MNDTCIILGAGGHAWVVVEALQLANTCAIHGILDSNAAESEKKEISDVPILGGDELLESLIADKKVNSFAVALGGVGDNLPRRRLFELASGMKLKPLNVIHPTAIRSRSAHYGKGVQLLAASVVSANAHIGDNVIINTGAIIEHDCVIGHHAHIATGARLAGSVTVGNNAHIGAGAVIRQGIHIGDYAVVGAGAVVVKDVPEKVTVVGVPAAQIRP